MTTSAKTIFGAGLVLAFLILPVYVDGANLNSLFSVVNAGRTIHEGDTVYRSDFAGASNSWTYTFYFPYGVGNGQALLGIMRGTFGNLAGGTPQSGVNYVATFQTWNMGTSSIVKSLNFQPGGTTMPSGTYTAVVANEGGTGNTAGFTNWFASGGAAGQAPSDYSFLTFNYIASERVDELPGALNHVQYASRIINDGDDVVNEEVIPNTDNPTKFWRFTFDWPNAVDNSHAAFMVFRGTFGALENNIAVNGVTYAGSLQVWPAGHNQIGKFINIPGLENASSSTYTVMVAELNPAGTLATAADWFASGGAGGVDPRRYSLITFDLSAEPPCCSSVAFIPGFEGSVLKEGTNTLWPPSILSDDLSRLALHPDGTSVNTITVEGLLETFYGTSIYGGFSSFMDDLVASTTAHVHEWKPLPYDWRFSPEDIVTEAGMVAAIEQLAADAENGKVTLVAHSMGGLVGKALIKGLMDKGEGDLVESFIMVGVPQLGTPQAVASILHGDDQGIAASLIVRRADARAIAQHMPSAYALLPSPKYFDRVVDPVIVFNPESSFTDEWRAYWGPAIQNYLDSFAFMTGGGVARFEPPYDLLRVPEVIEPTLLADAANFHNEYDGFAFPPSLRVVQVAGWGIPTVKGIEYRDEHFLQNYRVLSTTEGDKTVVYPSAISSLTASIFFNLARFNALEDTPDFQHRNLLNAPPIQDVIKSIVQQGTVSLDFFLSVTKPEPANLDDQIVVSTHSPVILGAYDNAGNFTGVNPGQDPNAAVWLTSEGIPGSTFIASGDSEYIFLPQGGVYDFVIEGTGPGTFTLEATEIHGDTPGATTGFAEIPVTLDTHAAISIAGDLDHISNLNVDINGDYTDDLDLAPATGEVVTFMKTPVTVRADDQMMILGGVLPTLTYALDPTLINPSAITGAADCSTTATAATAGEYAISCSLGTLASYVYDFSTFLPGTLKVQYRWSGFLQPIDDVAYNPGQTTSVFKAGSTVPVKFQIKDAAGAPVQAVMEPIWLAPVKLSPLSAPVDETVYSASPTSGNTFRYDGTSQQYIYNWSTKGFAGGYWYRISAQLDDGTVRSVVIGLR